MSRYRVKLHRRKEEEKKRVRSNACRKTNFILVISAVIYLLVNYFAINVFNDFILVRLILSIGSLIIIAIAAGSLIFFIEERRDRSLRDIDRWYHYRHRI